MTNNHAAVFCWIAVLAWAIGAGAQTAGRGPLAGQPLSGGMTVIDLDHAVTSSGELRMWRAASTEGARVMLKVYRPDGDRLLLVGTSPLETVPPGGVGTFGCRIPVARNDIIGTFCPDSSCVDAFADGRILSAQDDRGTSPESDFASGTGSPAIYAAGWALADVPSAAGTDLVVPVVGRTPGVGGTLWSTTLEIHNTADSPNPVVLFLNLSDVDNTTPAGSAQLTVDPRETVVVEDLIGELFGLDEAVGSVDVVASAPVMTHARIANIGSDVGTFGQSVPGVPASWTVGDDGMPGLPVDADHVLLFEVQEDVSFRSNLGVASTVGTPVTVVVTAYVGTDQVGSTLQLDLAPYSHTQVNRVFDELGVTRGTPGVRLELSAADGSGGRFLAYLSKVDNDSGDAVFLLGDRPVPSPHPPAR